MNDPRQVSPSTRRIGRILSFALTILGASLAVYWAIKWLRGDPDEYTNEIAGGLTLTTALTLLTSADLVRTAKTRWAFLGAGAVLVVINLAVIIMAVRISLLTVVALLLILGSIGHSARVLWPARRVKMSEWRTTPVTLQQRRALCDGMAILNLGAALLCFSLFGMPRGPWQATVVAVFTTMMFVGGAVFLFALRARLRA